MKIRTERMDDYPQLSRVHWEAFGGSYAESLLVHNHRLRADFDRDCSLVAEDDGRIVGHALFSPRTLLIMGEPVNMVNLAPVGVSPACQNRGVGSRLIQAGLAKAREKGYAGCFLLGHPTYYPRFGFVTRAYSRSFIRVQVQPWTPHHDYGSRPFRLTDIPELLELWAEQEKSGTLALLPDPDLCGWLSPQLAVQTLVLEHKGVLAGYIRYICKSPIRIYQIIARDRTAVQQLLVHAGAQPDWLSIPLDPTNLSTERLFADYEVIQDVPASGMICSFGAPTLDEYLQTVQTGSLVAGRLLWPCEFDGTE